MESYFYVGSVFLISYWRLTIRWSRLEIQPDLPRVEFLSERKASCSLEEHQDLRQLKAVRHRRTYYLYKGESLIIFAIEVEDQGLREEISINCKARFLPLFLLVNLILVSCSSSQAEIDYLSTLTPISRAVTQTQAFVETKTAQITFTDTIISTPTLSEPILITPTPFPTLSPSDAELLVSNLLKDNNDCVFPCWWGFIPGKTDTTSFKSFIYSLGGFAGPWQDENGVYFYIEFPVEEKLIHLRGGGYFDDEKRYIEWIKVFTEIDREIDGGYETLYGDQLYFDYFMRYSIANLLSTYGEPSNILVYVIDSWWPLSLILYYEESSIFVDFQMPAHQSGDQYKACPSEAIAHLWLWSSDKHYSISEVLLELDSLYKIQYLGPAKGYVPIEDATGLTISDFMQIFSNPANTSCILLPTTLWQ